MSIKFIEENQKGYARTANKTFFCCLFLKPWFMEPNEQYTVLQNDAKFQIFILFYKPKMWDQRESLKINFWLQRLLWENSRFWHTQEIQFFQWRIYLNKKKKFNRNFFFLLFCFFFNWLIINFLNQLLFFWLIIFFSLFTFLFFTFLFPFVLNFSDNFSH